MLLYKFVNDFSPMIVCKFVLDLIGMIQQVSNKNFRVLLAPRAMVRRAMQGKACRQKTPDKYNYVHCIRNENRLERKKTIDEYYFKASDENTTLLVIELLSSHPFAAGPGPAFRRRRASAAPASGPGGRPSPMFPACAYRLRGGRGCRGSPAAPAAGFGAGHRLRPHAGFGRRVVAGGAGRRAWLWLGGAGWSPLVARARDLRRRTRRAKPLLPIG
jgi:hypothetical protein